MDVNPGLYLRSSEATGMEFILDKTTEKKTNEAVLRTVNYKRKIIN